MRMRAHYLATTAAQETHHVLVNQPTPALPISDASERSEPATYHEVMYAE